MAFEIDNYAKLVLEDYWEKIKELPQGLVEPTNGSIRDACLLTCGGGVSKRDEAAIRQFFVEEGSSKTCLEIIESCNIEKFKQINKFIKRKGKLKMGKKHIELLAWLVGFEDRPYDMSKKYGPALAEVLARKEMLRQGDRSDTLAEVKKGVAVINEEVADSAILEVEVGEKVVTSVPKNESDAGDATGKPVPALLSGKKTEFKKVTFGFPRRKILVIGGLVFLLGTGGYWWWDNQSMTVMGNANGGCMYWTGDHYQPIPCNQKVEGAMVVALDTGKVKNFKKILNKDTITYRGKGVVWYSKINNNVEFFTAGGAHPVVFSRRLKPATEYMINKYAHGDTALNP